MPIYTFKNKELLQHAFSYGTSKFSQLEWVGDNVLKLVQGDWCIAQISPHLSRPRDLNMIRDRIQSNKHLASMCDQIGWTDQIICQHHEKNSKTKAGVFEAVFGAVYKDSGNDIEECRKLWNTLYVICTVHKPYI